MKGDISTAEFMGAIVKRENDLRTRLRMSAIGFYDPKPYHKLIAVTDFGMNIAPTADVKAEIIRGAVALLRKFGIERPKVAVLSDTEKVDVNVKASVDASLLREKWERGEIPDCVLEGPLPFDVAVSRTAGDVKRKDSEVSGDADLLVVPDIVAGNILVKAMTIWGGMHTAGTILGAKIPVVMTSRSATADDKYYSICLAAAAAI